jgi:hypothetical protein
MVRSTKRLIRSTAPLPDVDMVPQAIFGRPIYYFTLDYRKDHDDLDAFKYAAFTLDNDCHFSLRHYDGHPKRTATLYLEYVKTDVSHLRSLIELIIDGFNLPKAAVRWRRGDPIKFGVVPPPEGRLKEPEARILALKIAVTRPKRQAATIYIKERIPEYVPLTREDLKPSPTRKNEKKWQQVVGNVISHHAQSTSIFSQGYANRTDDGIRVTRLGIEYLNDMGFSRKPD